MVVTESALTGDDGDHRQAFFGDASEAATGSFNDTIDIEGWAYLDIHTNPDTDDFLAAKVCGGLTTTRLCCWSSRRNESLSLNCTGCWLPRGLSHWFVQYILLTEL